MRLFQQRGKIINGDVLLIERLGSNRHVNWELSCHSKGLKVVDEREGVLLHFMWLQNSPG